MGYYFADFKRRLSGKSFLYEHVSSGLYDILVWQRKNDSKEKPNVILPAYVSADISRSVAAAGYEPRYYDIPPGCQTDVDQVECLIDDQTCAVICKHVFGIPASVRAVKSCTVARDILLIEDCTETLNSSWQGEEPGSVGDCAIFNPAKLLQLPAGGFVVVRNKLSDFQPRYMGQVGSIWSFSELFRLKGRHAYYCLTRGEDPLGLAKTAYAAGTKRQLKLQPGKVRKIGWLNKTCIYSVNLNQMTQVRRANYEYLLNGIKDLSFIEPVTLSDPKIVFERNRSLHLHKGITPCSLPVLVPPEMRSLLLKVLAGKGIECEAGQIQTLTGLRSFSRSEELSQGLLELPVHQGINRYQLDRIISCMRACQDIEVTQTDKIRKAV